MNNKNLVYFIEDTHPNRQGLWFGSEEVPLTSWETTFVTWTNDPLKAFRFKSFDEAQKVLDKLNMKDYIVTEHEFIKS